MYDEVPGEYWGYEPNPTLEIILLIAIVAAFVAGLWFAGWRAGKTHKALKEEAATSIYEAINAAARRAAAAVGPAALYASQLLIEEIRARLGAVIDLGSPLGAQLKALEAAVKGVDTKQETKTVRPPACTCACTCACSTGEGAAKAKAADDSQAQGQGQGQGQSQVSILTSGSVILAAPAAPQPTTTPQTDKPTLEHHQKVRLVAGDFAHYWGAKDQRLSELRAAQKALLTPAPKPKTDGSKPAQ